jgi:hypothetical protein
MTCNNQLISLPLSSLVYHLQVRPEPTIVKHLGALLKGRPLQPSYIFE